MKVGDKVMVKYPFNTTYDSVYTIVLVEEYVYFLEGIEGGFDAQYLEVV